MQQEKEEVGRPCKKLKRKMHPDKVFWRYANQNMPRAWDLEQPRDECSSGRTCTSTLPDSEADKSAPCLTREGLAVIRNCSDWWNTLVCTFNFALMPHYKSSRVHQNSCAPVKDKVEFNLLVDLQARIGIQATIHSTIRPLLSSFEVSDTEIHHDCPSLQVHQEKPRKYPLDYPARSTAAGVNICRFHNYSTCLKRLSGDCQFDHDHCHACGASGHVAKDCDVSTAGDVGAQAAG